MSNTEALRTAAQAVLDRWDSPQWEWTKQSPTADLMHALRAALAQPAASGEPVAQRGMPNSPSDPEICNERSAQVSGPVYCGDSGGYCSACPKRLAAPAPLPACKGMNCGATDGRSHSLECHAEHAAAIAGGEFVKAAQPAPALVPPGWVLVPVNATPEMKAACVKAAKGWWDSRAWPAMLAAAPSAPQSHHQR